MALKTFVKVGSITNLTDARYCAGMGVDLLGFQVIEGTPQYISPKAFQEIRGWVSGPKVVAEIQGLSDLHVLYSILENYRPDYLELGVKEYSIIEGKHNLPYLITLALGEDLPLGAKPEMIVRTSTPPANAEDLIFIKSMQEAEAVLSKSVKGLALVGSVEAKPGLKEYNELSEILEMLETDD